MVSLKVVIDLCIAASNTYIYVESKLPRRCLHSIAIVATLYNVWKKFTNFHVTGRKVSHIKRNLYHPVPPRNIPSHPVHGWDGIFYGCMISQNSSFARSCSGAKRDFLAVNWSWQVVRCQKTYAVTKELNRDGCSYNCHTLWKGTLKTTPDKVVVSKYINGQSKS